MKKRIMPLKLVLHENFVCMDNIWGVRFHRRYVIIRTIMVHVKFSIFAQTLLKPAKEKKNFKF
jgi:hypothetical protein